MSVLKNAIEKSGALANKIGVEVEGLSFAATPRAQLAAALISISLGHHVAVVDLFSRGRFAAGVALVRSEIDCFMRALWVSYSASDNELAGFLKGNDPPPTRKIMALLEGRGIFDIGTTGEVLDRLWPVVCDFNHGGGRMVSRHLGGNEIRPNFEDGELIEALSIADLFGLGAACALSDVANDRDLGDRLLSLG